MEAVQIISAVWKDGVFQPGEKPELQEGAEVELAVTRKAEDNGEKSPTLPIMNPLFETEEMDAPYTLPFLGKREKAKVTRTIEQPPLDLSRFDNMDLGDSDE